MTEIVVTNCERCDGTDCKLLLELQLVVSWKPLQWKATRYCNECGHREELRG